MCQVAVSVLWTRGVCLWDWCAVGHHSSHSIPQQIDHFTDVVISPTKFGCLGPFHLWEVGTWVLKVHSLYTFCHFWHFESNQSVIKVFADRRQKVSSTCTKKSIRSWTSTLRDPGIVIWLWGIWKFYSHNYNNNTHQLIPTKWLALPQDPHSHGDQYQLPCLQGFWTPQYYSAELSGLLNKCTGQMVPYRGALWHI